MGFSGVFPSEPSPCGPGTANISRNTSEPCSKGRLYNLKTVDSTYHVKVSCNWVSVMPSYLKEDIPKVECLIVVVRRPIKGFIIECNYSVKIELWPHWQNWHGDMGKLRRQHRELLPVMSLYWPGGPQVLCAGSGCDGFLNQQRQTLMKYKGRFLDKGSGNERISSAQNETNRCVLVKITRRCETSTYLKGRYEVCTQKNGTVQVSPTCASSR